MSVIYGIKSIYKKVLEEMTKEDSPEVQAFAFKEYGYMYLITGCYLDLSTPKGQLIFVVYFVTLILNCLFHGILMVITIIKAYSWSIDITAQMLTGLSTGAIGFSLYLSVVLFRPAVARLHWRLGPRAFRYHSEPGACPRTLALRRYAMRFTKGLYPLVTVSTLLAYVLAKPPFDQSRIRGVELALPFTLWYPFAVDSGWLYALAVSGQVFGCIQFVLLMIFCIIAFFNISTHLLVDVTRLSDSIYAIEKRAQILFECKEAEQSLRHEGHRMHNRQKTFAFCIKYCIQENIRHHVTIKRQVRDFNCVMSIPMLVSYTMAVLSFGTSAACFLLGEFLSTKITSTVVTLVCFSTLAFMCTIGELTLTVSAGLQFAIYDFKWYLADRELMPIIKIFMEGTKKPIRPMAFNVVSFDYEALSLLLRAAYSVFNLLTISSGLRR